MFRRLAYFNGQILPLDDVQISPLDRVNLLGNIMAAQSAREAGCLEAILVDRDDLVTEGSHTNVFCVMEGKVRTAPASHHILSGVTRDLIIQLSTQEEIDVIETAVNRKTLLASEEIFISGTTSEVMPVTEVDGQTIGTGHPGPVTKKIATAFQRHVAIFRSKTA